jgi:hypothetical protein
MKTITIRSTLCAIGFALILSVAVPAGAAAKGQNNGNFASGNSAVSQYVESYPTAGGGTPSGRIRPGGHHGKKSGSGPLSPSTQRALAQGGQSGEGAAAFANATSPSASGTRSGRPGTPGAAGSVRSTGAHNAGSGKAGANGTAGSAGSVATRVGAVAGATSDGSSPLKSVLTAFTGGSTTGGLGLFLPVLLIVILLGGCAVGFAHRARRSST